MSDDTISCSCLCGAVRFEITRPEKVTSCNCSACRRYATLWGYAPPAEARFLAGEGETIGFTRGERGLAFHHCPTCGCVTHWQGLINDRLAFNMRLADDPADLVGIPIHHFDGADSWTTTRIEETG